MERGLLAELQSSPTKAKEKFLNRLAILYVNSGKEAQAEEALEKALAINPLSIQSIANLYSLKLSHGKALEAGSLISGALAKAPESLLLNRLYAQFLESQGRSAEAGIYLVRSGLGQEQKDAQGRESTRAGIETLEWFADPIN